MLLLVLFSGAARGAAAETGPAEFQKLVQPLLRDHCLRCHGPAKQEARLQLHKLSGAMAEDGAQTWETILEQLQAGAMPPKAAKQPAAPDLKLAVAWIQNELRAAAQAESLIARVYPAQGNRLDHDLLFKVGADATAAAPLRVWRVNTEIYKAAIARIARKDFQDRKGKFNFAPPWGLTSDEGFKDYAALYRIDEPETGLLLGNAQQAARAMLNKTGRFAAESKPYQTFLAADAANDELVRATVQAAFRQVLQREPNADEHQRYAKLLKEGGVEFGRDKGLELMLSAVLLHPDLVFRFEVGDGKTDALGRSLLAPRELADALAFALTDLGPDVELLQAVRDGKLVTRADAARHAQRLLDDPKIEKPRILRFFQEYFGYSQRGKAATKQVEAALLRVSLFTTSCWALFSSLDTTAWENGETRSKAG